MPLFADIAATPPPDAAARRFHDAATDAMLPLLPRLLRYAPLFAADAAQI